jgi:glycosyltransferase involved in cell wall biosynthesis
MANLGRRKTKLMISLHSVTSKKLENYNLLLIKSLIGLFFNSFDKIHVLSETLKIDLIKNYRVNNGKIVVIANPIEISRINELKKEKISDSWYNPNDAYIINIGRLTKVKGQHNLIKAFSKILLKSDCKLLICGKGELEEDLIQLVKRLNIEDKVFFLGWVNNPYKYLASSKIFVMTSLYEAFPVAMIEAMACDLPVISTKCGFGPDEILGDGKYGILTPSMDTNQITIPDLHSLSEQIFVDEVLNILTDDDKRKDWVKRSQIRAKFYDVKNILRKYRNTFDNL